MLTAVLINNILTLTSRQATEQDRQFAEEEAQVMKSLCQLFLQIDEDSSGVATVRELTTFLQKAQPEDLLMDGRPGPLTVEEVREVAEIVGMLAGDDLDTGVAFSEFVNVAMRVRGPGASKDRPTPLYQSAAARLVHHWLTQ